MGAAKNRALCFFFFLKEKCIRDSSATGDGTCSTHRKRCRRRRSEGGGGEVGAIPKPRSRIHRRRHLNVDDRTIHKRRQAPLQAVLAGENCCFFSFLFGESDVALSCTEAGRRRVQIWVSY